MTSGFRLIHHEGGSIFVTTGAFAFCVGSVWPNETEELKVRAAAPNERTRSRRLKTDRQSNATEIFTREA